MTLFNEDDEDEDEDENEDEDDGWVEKEPQSEEENARDAEINATWFNYNTNVGGW